MELPRLRTGYTIYEITGIFEFQIIEYRITNIIFTGYSYILPDKAVGKCEFFENDFGTILFSSFSKAYEQLLILKEVQKNGKQCHNTRLFSFFSK